MKYAGIMWARERAEEIFASAAGRRDALEDKAVLAARNFSLASSRADEFPAEREPAPAVAPRVRARFNLRRPDARAGIRAHNSRERDFSDLLELIVTSWRQFFLLVGVVFCLIKRTWGLGN